MARYRVLFHSEVNGKFDAHFGHRQVLITATGGSDGYPIPANISTAISGNSLHNTKANAVTVLDNVANLDPAAALTAS